MKVSLHVYIHLFCFSSHFKFLTNGEVHVFEEADIIKGFRSYIGINLSLLIIVRYQIVS